MYNAVDVAWKLLQVADNKGIKLSNLQLQKLIYVAHGYLLGWKNKPLVDDEIEAWKYGPVVDSVYNEFKRFVNKEIPTDNISELKTELDSDPDATEVINGVLNLYGTKTAVELVSLTHQEDTPWDIVWQQDGGQHSRSIPIPSDVIKNHFRKVITSPDNVNGL